MLVALMALRSAIFDSNLWMRTDTTNDWLSPDPFPGSDCGNACACSRLVIIVIFVGAIRLSILLSSDDKYSCCIGTTFNETSERVTCSRNLTADSEPGALWQSLHEMSLSSLGKHVDVPSEAVIEPVRKLTGNSDVTNS